MDREINIFLDEGRPLRPLWHLEDGGQWSPLAALVLAEPLVTPNWKNLVLGTYPFPEPRTINDITFIDPIANKNSSLQDYVTLLEQYMGAIEYIDPYESNEAYISWYGASDLSSQHTHVEIHPSTMSGLMVSLIPFYNHNQSPRNQLSCSQSKQGIGYYATNYLQRYDTYGSQLCYGEAPIVRSMVQDHVGRGSIPYGYNCIVAMASTDGYNQDDGILFNRSSVERGMFRSLALRSYEALEEIDPISKVEYKIANPKMIPTWSDLKPGSDYSMLDESGIIKVDSVISDNTVLVGRYLENPETHQIKDSSIMPTVFTKGRVESVVVLNQANGFRLVKVRIIQERIPELGDKFGSRHGQKGTMGMIIPAENMPHTKEGIIPDVIVNPHGLTSRMTVAQVIEVLFGRLGAEVAAKCNGTAFCNRENIVKTVGTTLEELGLHPHTENIMYCGTTGKQLNCSIFMGPLYFMRMKHLTSDKINSRAEGRREIRTHQPTGGRGNEGGMRIGEMERDAVLAHGVSLFLQESMMKRADATSFWVCNGCGTIPISNEKEMLFVCPSCDGPVEFSGATSDTITLVQPLKRSRVTFSKIDMPYSLKLLDQELTTFMGAGLRFVTSKTVGRLKDNMLVWPKEGSGIPEPPKAYTELVKEIIPLETNPLIPDNELPGADNKTYFGSVEPTGLDIHIGGGTNVIGNNDNAIGKLIDLQQIGGEASIDSIGQDTKPIEENTYLKQDGIPIDRQTTTQGAYLQKGGAQPSDAQPSDAQPSGALINSIGKDTVPVKHDLEEEWPQQGGTQLSGANIESLGKDTVPVKHDLEEEWSQKGGAQLLGAPIPDIKLTMPGTDINPATFSQPQMAEEPYVIANPYTSPPLTELAPKPDDIEVGKIQVPAQLEQPVSAAPEITNVIKVFENSDIRVIKLA